MISTNNDEPEYSFHARSSEKKMNLNRVYQKYGKFGKNFLYRQFSQMNNCEDVRMGKDR